MVRQEELMDGELSCTGLYSNVRTVEVHEVCLAQYLEWPVLGLSVSALQNATTCGCCTKDFKKILIYPHYLDAEFTPFSIAEEIKYNSIHQSQYSISYTNTKMSNVKALPPL